VARVRCDLTAGDLPNLPIDLLHVSQGSDCIRQIETSDPEIYDPDRFRPILAHQPLDDLASKGVVAQKDVADPGDQYSRLHHSTPSGLVAAFARTRGQTDQLAFNKSSAIALRPAS
jgi:hypothetical protein